MLWGGEERGQERDDRGKKMTLMSLGLRALTVVRCFSTEVAEIELHRGGGHLPLVENPALH